MGLIADIKDVASHSTERKNPAAQNTNQQFYNPQEGQPQPEAKKAPVPGEGSKITKEEAEQTGTTNAYLLSSITEMVRGGILLYKHVKCLTPDEKVILELANTKNEKDLTDRERSVVFKYAKASAKYDKKKEKIQTTDSDMKMLSEGFTHYSEVTGKKTTPNLMLAALLTKYISSIAMDSFLD